MKRRDLIKQLEQMGCEFIRHGSNHDWYQNPRTKVSQPIPRHSEINENLAKHIIKVLRDSSNTEPGNTGGYFTGISRPTGVS